jgi:hypothetical protein
MRRLARVNGTQAFLATLPLVVIGLFAPGWIGALILFALIGGLIAILVQTAARSQPGTVVVRLVILAGFSATALYKIIT